MQLVPKLSCQNCMAAAAADGFHVPRQSFVLTFRASADMSCHTSISRKRKIINTIKVVEGFLPGENFCSKKALCTSVHHNLKCFYSSIVNTYFLP